MRLFNARPSFVHCCERSQSAYVCRENFQLPAEASFFSMSVTIISQITRRISSDQNSCTTKLPSTRRWAKNELQILDSSISGCFVTQLNHICCAAVSLYCTVSWSTSGYSFLLAEGSTTPITRRLRASRICLPICSVTAQSVAPSLQCVAYQLMMMTVTGRDGDVQILGYGPSTINSRIAHWLSLIHI